MSTWKVQKFFGDIVYDLRTRGLLPIAILLVAGLFAVPILVTRSGGDEPLSAPTSQPSAADLAPENQAAVVNYQPGLRDYRKRLGELGPKNPFTQQFAGPAAGAAEASATDGTTAGSTGDTGSPTTGGDTGGTTTGGGTVTHTRTYYYYEADVLVGEVGAKQKKITRVHNFTYLPSQNVPVVTYLGASDGPKAVFLVSDAVVGIEGAQECSPSPEDCQLMALGANTSAQLIYAPDGKTYSIKVTRVELVSSKKLPKK